MMKIKIKQIQYKLKRLNYYTGKIDEIFGEKSKQATKKFQSDYKIKKTGRLNKKTIKKLNFIYMTTYENEINANYDKFKNFNKKEFRCPKYCSGFPVEMKHQTIEVLQRARDYFNSPCLVSSGIRCKKYNNALKNSAENSKHLYGKAIDCSINGISGNKLKRFFKKQPEVKYTYIIKKNWVHFNIY